MLYSHILGITKIDEKRKLKFLVEKFLFSKKNKKDEIDLLREIRKIKKNLISIQDSKLDITTFGMFPYYDKILTLMLYLGLVPKRYFTKKKISIKKMFEISKGSKNKKPLEMTKWFNTNYHYLVSELSKNSLKFFFKNNFLKEDLYETNFIKNETKFSIIGPITFVILSKFTNNKKSTYKNIIKRYIKIIKVIEKKKIDYLQIEEPVLDILKKKEKKYFLNFYNYISKNFHKKIILTIYFSRLDEKKINFLKKINSYGIHLNYTIKNEINKILIKFKKKKINVLSLGIIDGSNIWISDYNKIINNFVKIKLPFVKKFFISHNTSLEYIPYSLRYENLSYVSKWFSFSLEKIKDIFLIKKILIFGKKYYKKEYNKNKFLIICKNLFNKYSDKIIENKIKKTKLYKKRKIFKNKIIFPTTTIGSFPQTKEIRKARSSYINNKNYLYKYRKIIKKNIKKNINFQKKIGIDVFVHGEPERNDMVEYFCNRFYGCLITKSGWVHSYGTRCVKPPIIYGTIINKNKCIYWMKYTKKLLDKKPLKGIITGPITMLKWSFKRNNISDKKILLQFSLALRKELKKIKNIGINIIQIDEPALKESMPQNLKEKKKFISHAIKSFKFVFSGINNLQIHTHICYSKLDIFDIKIFNKMDIDVISIESARSFMNAIKIFKGVKLNFEIGLGVFDIHSIYKTSKKNIFCILKKIFFVLKKNIWINPDCGLKTRSWKEIKKPLIDMVKAAKIMKKLKYKL
ncbi:5-methyltetrahydropteroyltriglutamate--homocysteine S-methyltransferase [Candidatus Vidania fulgoroideae]|nr:5-methyltetrahydropteroyltriglutamate--homocysteine S-methyltransferase [Candidatus Vidania fulgoroideae]